MHDSIDGEMVVWVSLDVDIEVDNDGIMDGVVSLVVIIS